MSACNDPKCPACNEYRLKFKYPTFDLNNKVFESVETPGYMYERLKTVKDLLPPTIAETFKTEYSQENMYGNVFGEELGGLIMRYWGKLCGSLFGTITYANLNDDGTVTIYTNYDESMLKKDGLYYEGWNNIKKETVDKLKLHLK